MIFCCFGLNAATRNESFNKIWFKYVEAAGEKYLKDASDASKGLTSFFYNLKRKFFLLKYHSSVKVTKFFFV